MMNKNIDINVDPVALAEDFIGKRHEEWDTETDGMIALGIAMATNNAKVERFKEMGDTYFGVTWAEFLKLVKDYGFKVGYSEKFTGINQWEKKSVEEEEVIFYNEERGLILYAESYNGTSVNSAEVYAEVKIGEFITDEQREALNGCSHGVNEIGTMYVQIDVREGLRFHLEALFKAFELSKTWSTVPFLWFLNYMDIRDKDYDYMKINRRKLDACMPEVSKIIFG